MNLLHLLVTLLILQLPICFSSSIPDLFENWCKQHGKSYISIQEKQHRLKIFEHNLEIVVNHNRNVNSSYKLSLNPFADLTNHEFKAKYMGLSLSRTNSVIRLNSRESFDERSILGKESVVPVSVDWRKQGAVTRVKDQGSCGSCWSFSATGAMEGINKIVTGSLVSLSEQELIDCDESNGGCGGGLMDNAYEFVIKNKGINTEKDYPYEWHDMTCDRNKLKRHVVTIDSYADIPAKNEKKLLEAVATQPISVGICASGTDLQLYSGGIFTGPCPGSLNHAVLIVGYDTKDGQDYWIIKNSWSKYWGIDGYMHMLRNTGNEQGVCGINMIASYPIKTSPNPPPSPPTDPVECDFFTSCTSDETCCCSYSIFGICFSWKCCAAFSATCCEDQIRCCPHDYPICDTGNNMCLKLTGNGTLVKQPGNKAFQFQ